MFKPKRNGGLLFIVNENTADILAQQLQNMEAWKGSVQHTYQVWKQFQWIFLRNIP